AVLVGIAAVLAPADRALAVEPDRNVDARGVDVREQARAHALLASRVAGAGLPLGGHADRALVGVRGAAAVLGRDAVTRGQRAAHDVAHRVAAVGGVHHRPAGQNAGLERVH